MKNTFIKNKPTEDILSLIKQDPELLDKLNVDELEFINEYLKDYENYLKQKKGDV